MRNFGCDRVNLPLTVPASGGKGKMHCKLNRTVNLSLVCIRLKIKLAIWGYDSSTVNVINGKS